MEKIIIREIRTEEFPLLKNLLYEAIFQPEGTLPLPFEIIYNPDIYVYIDNFGQQTDDYCLVAEMDNKIAGAVWIRILSGGVKGYGNIDNETPEFAISLFKEYRKKGYGTLLMKAMIDYMRKKGYKQTSLSVNKDNYAARMYKNLGFKVIKENEEDYLMVLQLL